MEAMHLCCKVEINNGVPNSHVDRLFIPALLTDRSGLEQLQWRSSTKHNVDDDIFVYMGRRLECEKTKTPTFLQRVCFQGLISYCTMHSERFILT